MTDSQRMFLMVDLWPNACKANGWKPSDKAKRLAVLSEALGRPVNSANEINTTDDFDRVKAHLLTQAGSLKGAIEQVQPERGEARRWLAVIGQLTQCLALYHSAPAAFIASLIKDKFHGGGGSILKAPALRDLRPGQLQHLMMTLSARINVMRNQAGDSLHQMKTRARVYCDCAHCCAVRRAALKPKKVFHVEPLIEGQPF